MGRIQPTPFKETLSENIRISMSWVEDYSYTILMQVTLHFTRAKWKISGQHKNGAIMGQIIGKENECAASELKIGGLDLICSWYNQFEKKCYRCTQTYMCLCMHTHIHMHTHTHTAHATDRFEKSRETTINELTICKNRKAHVAQCTSIQSNLRIVLLYVGFLKVYF